MTKGKSEGRFEIIESFAIASRKEFYLIGQIKEGSVQENWFVRIGLNSTLDMTVRIKAVEAIVMASDKHRYTLIIINGEEEISDFLLAFKLGNETVRITIDGED